MIGDPSPKTDANRRDLAAPRTGWLRHENPCKARTCSRSQAERGERIDEPPLECAQEPVYIGRTPRSEVTHEISHELSWAVVGHVPTTRDRVQLNTLCAQLGRGHENVGRIGTAAESDDGGMLEQKQRISRDPSADSLHLLLLELERLEVRDAT